MNRMKVSELIALLSKANPDAEVDFVDSTGSWDIYQSDVYINETNTEVVICVLDDVDSQDYVASNDLTRIAL
jgi:hypothetical protein